MAYGWETILPTQTPVSCVQRVLLILMNKSCFRHKRTGILSQNKKNFDVFVPEIAVLVRNGNCWILADLTSSMTDRPRELVLRLKFHHAEI